MKYAKKYKTLIIFLLASVFFLLIYDLFNGVEKRGEVTSSRNIPRAFRTIILLLSVFFYFDNYKIIRSNFKKIFLSIYGLIFFYIFLDTNIDFSSLVNVTKLLYLVFLYLILFKVFVKNFNISKKYIKYFIILSVVSLTINLIINRFATLDVSGKVYGDNTAYVLLSFLPILYCIEFRAKKILVVTLIFGVLFTLKRGAILALFLSFLPVLFGKSFNNSNTISFQNIFFIGLFVFLFFVFFSKFEDLIINRFDDFSGSTVEEFGSGRGNVYSTILSVWYNSNSFLNYIFGNGYRSVEMLNKRLTGRALMAHSDLFNFIHSYGLLGLSLLLYFTIYQFRISFKLYKLKSHLYLPYLMFSIIFLFKGIYSGNIDNQNFAYLIIGYAFINAKLKTLNFNA